MTRLLITYPYVYQTLATIFFGCMLLFAGRWKKGRSRTRNPNGLPLPPGPKGYPLIGNLFDFPIYNQCFVYEEWRKIYGDIVYLNILGQPFLILGSLQRTTDLLEKRSSNYSDRMRLPMLVELMKWDFSFAFLPYGPLWRKDRRTFQEFFHQNQLSKYLPIQNREVHAFLRRLLVTPDNFLHHIRL
jgi:cytochrome P450